MRTSVNWVVAAAAVAFAASQTLPESVIAQQGRAQPDYGAVEYRTTNVAGNLHVIQGSGPSFYPSPGGRPIAAVGALAGPDGIFVVDASFAELTEKIVSEIQQISNEPIRFLVNTHLHRDHTSGNENFRNLGVAILARDELYARMAVGGRGGAPSAAALPLMTYGALQTLRMNGEEVQLIPVPQAHTDGDTIVRFVSADAIMTGDIFRADNSYPNIDLNNGGSLRGFLGALNTIIDLSGPNTQIIPGHGGITNSDAVAAQRDMAIAIRDRVATMASEGRSLEGVLAANVTAEYDSRGPEPLQRAERFVTQLYTEVTQAQ